MPAPMSPELTKQITDTIYAGRKIEAIKLYREHSGQGLKESKDFIDALERELREKEPTKFTAPPPGKGCLGAAILLVTGTLAVVVMVSVWW